MLTLITFLFFTGLVAVLTLHLTKRDDHSSKSGYFLGGRTLTGGFIAGSLMLTNLSTEQLVGLNGSAFIDGLSVMAWEVGACIALILMALVFLPRFLKRGISTVPEFLEASYGPSTRSIASIIFICAYALILLPIILYSGAVGLSTMLDLKSITGIADDTTILILTIIIVGSIGSVYAIFGGLRTIAVSDTLNGIGLLVGGILITYFGLHALGGSEGFFGGMERMATEHPEKMNSLGQADQSVPFHTLLSGVLILHIFYWCTNQQIIQRTLGAKNLAEGQKGVLLAGFLKLFGPLILVVPGIIAFHLYAEQGVAPDRSYGLLVRSVLPAPLTGFFAAAMIGAILSSFNSALNSTATLFSLGIYQKWIRPGADQKKVIHSGKYFSLLLAVFAMSTAPLLQGQESIFTHLQAMNAIYFIPLLSVVIAAFILKKASSFSANTGMAIGFTLMILETYGIGDHIHRYIHHFHYISLVFVLTVFWIIKTSHIGKRDEEPIESMTSTVDLTPWKHAKKSSLILLISVLVLYLSFANFSM